MSTYLHKHHKIPRHAGGTDDPSNIIELTVEEHAEAHRLLYEQYGRWQDYVAWQGLSKQTDRQDMRRLVASLSTQERMRQKVKDGTHHWLGGELQRKRVSNGTHHLLGGKIQRRCVQDGTHNFLGGEIQRRSNLRRVENGTNPFVGPKGNLDRLAAGTHPSQQKSTCPHCGKITSIGMFARWHGDKCKLK